MSEKCIKCGCDDPAMTKLVETNAVQNVRLETMDKKLDRICAGLYGSPEEPHKGLVVRVDRLEQRFALSVKMLWFLFTTSVGLVINKFWKG